MASQPSVQEVLLKGVKPKGIQPKGVPLKRSSVVKVISEKDRVSLSNPSTTLEANKQLFQGIQKASDVDERKEEAVGPVKQPRLKPRVGVQFPESGIAATTATAAVSSKSVRKTSNYNPKEQSIDEKKQHNFDTTFYILYPYYLTF